MPTDRPTTLHWTSQSEFSVGDVSFFATPDPAIYRTRVSDERSFLICKSKDMIEREFAILAQASTTNVVEIGIWQGGSVALLDCVFKPNKLVAIEHSKRELPALDAYIRARGREANVRLKCGVDQSDRSKMEAILTSEFGTEPIDIVIDDASHLYEESIASFL